MSQGLIATAGSRRLVTIDHGRVVHDGTAEELHARYGSRRRVVVDLDQPLPAPGYWSRGWPPWVPLRDLAVVEPEIEDVIAWLYAGG